MKPEILDRILLAAPLMHAAGPCSPAALAAIARHAPVLEYSAETGCGASTLLFSHLSRRHLVFTLGVRDDGYSAALASPLLRREAVTFVLGPTQRTLPGYSFAEKLDAALLDGPHAYPMPQLEYGFLFPHLREGALLAIDDLQIPSVFELYRFLRAEKAFELLEVAGRTGLFRRTDVAAPEPAEDGWWLQGVNQRTLLRFEWRDRLRALVPERLRRRVRQSRGLRIEAPREGEVVAGSGVVRGRARRGRVWVLARRRDMEGWWPQGEAAVAAGGAWSVECRYGEPRDAGYEFEIAAAVVNEPMHQFLAEWLAAGSGRPVALPPGAIIRRVVRG